MSANYSEALEQQLALWARHRGMEGFAGFAVRRLLTADTYWIDRSVQGLLASGAGHLPSTTTISDGLAPSPGGFVLFDESIPVVIDDGRLSQLFALQWAFEPIRRKSPQGGTASGYWLMTYMLGVGRAIVPSHWTSWFIGEDLATRDAREARFRDSNITDADSQTTDEVARLWASLCLFMNQRILSYSTVGAERHTRRRLERQRWEHQPVIRVVELRRRERIGEKQPIEPIEHAWSCQWMVRGHWRQQYYPSRKANQPIWITPYVKGPEDKPLKPPRATLFAVVR